MAITRTARGTAQQKTSSNTLTVSITIGTTGSSLIVVCGCTFGGITVTGVTVTWGSTTLNSDLQTSLSNNPTITVLSAHNVTAGTQTLTITYSTSSGAVAGIVAFATELNSPNGALTSGTGATGRGSTNPATTSSVTGTPNTGATVAWIAGVLPQRPNGDAAPTWTHPTTAGQKIGTTGGSAGSNIYVAEGFEIDSTTVTQSMSASLATAAAYAAGMQTYKEPVAPSAAKIVGVQTAILRASFY